MISNRDDIAQTRAVIEVEGEAIDGCSAFSYQSDVLAVGDPFSVTVPNPRGKYTAKFMPGAKVQLKLSNPRVNGGALTLKHTGRLIERQASSDRSGTRIQLGCADLGWHLVTCSGPLTYNLQRGTFGDLFTARGISVFTEQELPGLFDPRWGIAGAYDGPRGTWKATILTTNRTSLEQRLGERVTLTKSQAAAANLTGVFQRVYAIQVEAGDKVFDILLECARRFNLLVNVSSDGYMQVWSPDYNRKPLYRIEYHDDARRDRNNVESVRLIDSITGRYTEVTCVGEVVGLEFAKLNPNDPNAGRVYGTFSRPVLPFTYRNTFCDGELWKSDLAEKQAEWRYKREFFDSWTYEVQVKGHHQNGRWWESDTMVAVDDSVTGVQGNLYCSAVHYDSTPEGDVAHLTLKLPNLLSAAFGELEAPPNARFNSNITRAISK